MWFYMDDKTRIILGVCFSIVFICFVMWASETSVVEDNAKIYSINNSLNNSNSSLMDLLDVYMDSSNSLNNYNGSFIFNKLGNFSYKSKPVVVIEEGAFVKDNINKSQFNSGLNENENNTNISEYLESGGCSVISGIIQQKANDLTENCNNNWDKVSALFNFTKSIPYTPYYSGSKYGASNTLSADAANCCDHANVIVALCRSEGIPARYVSYGDCYFYDYNFSMGHVWAQVYLNGTWYSVDATGYNNQIGNIVNWNVEKIGQANHSIFI